MYNLHENGRALHQAPPDPGGARGTRADRGPALRDRLVCLGDVRRIERGPAGRRERDRRGAGDPRRGLDPDQRDRGRAAARRGDAERTRDLGRPLERAERAPGVRRRAGRRWPAGQRPPDRRRGSAPNGAAGGQTPPPDARDRALPSARGRRRAGDDRRAAPRSARLDRARPGRSGGRGALEAWHPPGPDPGRRRAAPAPLPPPDGRPRASRRTGRCWCCAGGATGSTPA